LKYGFNKLIAAIKVVPKLLSHNHNSRVNETWTTSGICQVDGHFMPCLTSREPLVP